MQGNVELSIPRDGLHTSSIKCMGASALEGTGNENQ